MAKQKQNHSQGHSDWLKTIGGGVVGALLVGGIGLATDMGKTNMSQNDVQKIVQQELKGQQKASTKSDQDGTKTSEKSLDITTDVSQIVSKVQDSVVSVVNLANRSNHEFYDLFGFTDPNNGGSSQGDNMDDYQTAGEGSGVVYKIEGDHAYIVTNNHVIDGQDALEIITRDGKKVKAELIGADKFSDLAVLKVPAKAVKGAIEFGDSSTLSVGEPAIAIGSPLGQEFASTVTYGIISALDRQVPVDLNQDGRPDWQVTAIQTDAAINPGNSGGALVNSAGQLIGINSMKISTPQVEGMGFAIPSNDVVKIIKQLEEKGSVSRPELGIRFADLYHVSLEEQERILKLPKDIEEGVVVMDVVPGSPADKAGLKQYDVITEFNGEKVEGTMQFRQLLYNHKPEDKVKVTYYRNGEKQTEEIQLQPQKEEV